MAVQRFRVIPFCRIGHSYGEQAEGDPFFKMALLRQLKRFFSYQQGTVRILLPIEPGDGIIDVYLVSVLTRSRQFFKKTADSGRLGIAKYRAPKDGKEDGRYFW